MRTFLLRERVVSDDTICLADEGKTFKGKYIAILKQHSFASPWTDTQTIIKFRKKKILSTYLLNNYTEEELEFLEL